MTTKTTPSIVIQDGKVLTKLIDSIKGRGKTLDRDIHKAAVSALAHGYLHGSTAHAENLLAAMPKSARAKALRVWLLDLGCFMVKEDGKTLGVDKAKRSAGFTQEAYATATPYYEYTKESDVPSPVEAMVLVQALIKRLSKAKSEGLLDDSSVLDKLLLVAPAVVPTAESTEPAKAKEPELEV